MSDDRWLVVGLGNPGEQYAGTRHNIGAAAVHLLADAAGTQLRRNKRVRCEVAEVTLEGERLVLAVPTSYMNRSGDPVQAVAAWYRIPPARLIVCHDDLDVEPGDLRVKRGGGNAGHRGLRDIDRALGTTDYLRVRIGVGRPPGRMAPKDFVLRRFAPAERDAMIEALQDVAEAVVGLVADGLEKTQNRFHAKR